MNYDMSVFAAQLNNDLRINVDDFFERNWGSFAMNQTFFINVSTLERYWEAFCGKRINQYEDAVRLQGIFNHG